MKKRTKRVIIILGIVCVLAVTPNLLMVAFLGSASIYSSVDEKIYEDEATFSTEEWKEGNKKTRYSFVDALIASNPVKNKSKDQVREILGDPDQIEKETIWHYDTERPGWRLIDFSGGGLSVEFDENNQVKEILDTRWID